jgi:hypothetical protein
MKEDFGFRIIQHGQEVGKVHTQKDSLESAMIKADEIARKDFPDSTLLLYKRIPVSSYLTKSSQKRLIAMITMEELKELYQLQTANPNKAADYEIELIDKYGKQVKGLKR